MWFEWLHDDVQDVTIVIFLFLALIMTGNNVSLCERLFQFLISMTHVLLPSLHLENQKQQQRGPLV